MKTFEVFEEFSEFEIIKRIAYKDMIDYIENDAEILIPSDEFFDENNQHITKKAYGHILLKYLCEELNQKFLINESRI